MTKSKDEFGEKNEKAQSLAFEKSEVSVQPETAVAHQNAVAAKSSIPLPTKSELEGLPPQVLENLTGLDEMVAEERIIGVMRNGLDFSVDKLIVGLYHKYKHVEPRHKVIARLNRMAKDGTVVKDQNRRSVYRLACDEAKPDVAEVAAAQLSSMT